MRTIEHCGNCGAALSGPFCSHCGQRAKSPIVSFREFTGDALDGLLSVDSRIWRTIIPLLFKPGVLTRDYLAGRRERYLPPFRTYLIMSLLFFMVASIFGTDWEVNVVDDEPSPADVQNSDVDTRNNNERNSFSCQKLQVDPAFLEERVRSACEKIQADSGNSLVRTLVDNIPIMMFLFIPFVAFLVKILYLFSHRKYIEHLLFLFHYHATFFLILSIIVILKAISESLPMLAIPTSIIAALGWGYIPAYLFIAMRRIYCQGWFLTSTKYVLLLVGYVITLFIALAATTSYTALML